MIQVRRVGHATLTTPNLDRAIEYYNEVIGLNVVARDKNSAVLATKVGLEAIALVKGEEAGLARLAFQVAPGTDLNDCIKELSKHGVSASRRSEISPGVRDSITFKDNKGTDIDIYAEYEFAPDKEKPVGIMPLKLGHVAYRCLDILPVMKFYQEVLGFRLSDATERMDFVRCSSDHHSIALARGHGAGLNHMAYEVPNFDGLMRGAGRMKQQGFNVEWGVGRHGPGDNIFSYFIEPNGFVTEYTAEVEQIDEATHMAGTPEYWAKKMPMPDRWGMAIPSQLLREAMSGKLTEARNLRCEDIISRKLAS
jgi:catechol-2,3-dioxygenase